MKKLAVLLALAAVLLAGCGTQGGEPAREDAPETKQTNPPNEAAVPEEGDIVIPIG